VERAVTGDAKDVVLDEPCDGDHDPPPCSDVDCWRAPDAARYPDALVRRAEVMNVHPERLMPHEGPGECSVCGCEPGDRHDLATHEANADLTGG
jgi:hypothetical protein